MIVLMTVDDYLGRGWATGRQRYQCRRTPDRRTRGRSLLDQNLLHHRVMKRQRRFEMWCGREQISGLAGTLDVVSDTGLHGTALPQ